MDGKLGRRPGRRHYAARGNVYFRDIVGSKEHVFIHVLHIYTSLTLSLSLSPPLLADITGEREMYYLDNLSIQEHLFVHAIYIYSIEYSCHSFPAPSSTVLTLHCEYACYPTITSGDSDWPSQNDVLRCFSLIGRRFGIKGVG